MRILIADDHTMFRNSLKYCLEKQGIEVVAEASDGMEAIKLARLHKPDALVLDMNMPGLNGIEVARMISLEKLDVKPMILTMHDDTVTILESFQAGVKGYVLKTLSCTELVEALKDVVRGKLYLSANITNKIVDAYLNHYQDEMQELTDRERQVLQLIAEGNASKQIARILNLTVKTVESHRNRMMRKLDICNVAGLVRYAIRKRMIQA